MPRVSLNSDSLSCDTRIVIKTSTAGQLGLDTRRLFTAVPSELQDKHKHTAGHYVKSGHRYHRQRDLIVRYVSACMPHWSIAVTKDWDLVFTLKPIPLKVLRRKADLIIAQWRACEDFVIGDVSITHS